MSHDLPVPKSICSCLVNHEKTDTNDDTQVRKEGNTLYYYYTYKEGRAA